MDKSTLLRNFAIIIELKMKIDRIIILLTCLLMPLFSWSAYDPTAYYTVDGEEYESTDYISDGEAPLYVEFRANPYDLADGISPAFEWRFSKDDDNSPFLTRYEENTTYEFVSSGTYYVALYVSESGDTDAELVSTITITISTSLLEMPNAFSPNGDGINDIYMAKSNHQSIIEFHAYIFNRWGQKLYEWTDIDGGWDGTYNGKQVADGVYFVLVKAKGADGTTYNIKRDVNILREYIEE